MKTTSLVLMLAIGHAMAADPITDALQKGLFEEEANHNLDGAIKAYQSVIDQTAEQRKLAATAVFRLGECYRKLNKTNEAVAQYQRVVREFSDHTQLSELSQKQLSALHATQPGELIQTAVPMVPDFETKELERLQNLLKENDVVNMRDQQRQTPLHNAAGSGYVKVAQFLLTNGADINARDQNGATPLVLASALGRKTMVEFLSTNGADINAYGTYPSYLEGQYLDGQPLHFAINEGRLAVAEILLAHGADVNGKCGAKGHVRDRTALHLAVEKGHLETTRLLLSKGADVNATDVFGRTPLMTAVNGAMERTVRLLLEYGADVNAQDNNRSTILHMAAYQSPGTLAAVLEKKPNLESKNSDGRTPLSNALALANIPTAEMLLKAGADPNADIKGRSLLFYAVHRFKSKAAVKLLLDHKADPNRPTPEGVTPLMYASDPANAEKLLSPEGTKPPTVSLSEQKALAEIAELLQAHGAKKT
ncbi:MAG TPA: ankyrin repeat domain-containing protein [Candidatus Binatia bacterium]|nr:ankyrin repeat domain-containing protein [Candidatus Binatia bacterium]